MIRRGSYIIPISILLLSRFVSELGSSVFTFTLSLYILDITGSAMKYSLILSFSILARVIANTVAGLAADRTQRKGLILTAEFVSGFLLFGLYALLLSKQLGWITTLWASVLLSILGSLLRVSINASIPDIFDEQTADKVNSLFQTSGALILIVGPVLGAVLYDGAGLASVLQWSAVSYLGSGIMLCFLSIPSQSVGKEKYPVVLQLKETIQYIKENPFLLFFLNTAAGMNFIFYPLSILVLPYISYHVLKVSGTQLAYIQSSWAFGMIGGSLFLMFLKSTRGFIQRFFDFMFLQGILIVGWAFSGTSLSLVLSEPAVVSIYCGMVFVIGVLQMFVQIPLYTYFQFRIAKELRGRVWGMANTMMDMAAPFGLWVYGLLLEGVVWTWVTIFSGLAVSFICILLKAGKFMKSVDRELSLSDK